MKFLIYFFLAAIAPAAELQFAWDANPEPDIAGYRLHFGTEVGAFPRTIDCGNTTTFGTEVTERYVMVTAYNTAGLESLPSNVIDLEAKPGAPNGFRVTLPDPENAMIEISEPGEMFVLEGSENMVDWVELAHGYDCMIAYFSRHRRYFYRVNV